MTDILQTLQKAGEQLQNDGFRIQARSAKRKSITLCRLAANDLIQQQIHCFESSRHQGQFLVNLALKICPILEIPPSGGRFYDDGIHVEMGSNGIFPVGWQIWKEWAEYEEMLVSIRKEGIPWLEKLSNLEELIQHLEDALENGIPVSPPVSYETIKREFIWRLFFGKTNFPDVTRPPVYMKYLANLYYAVGDIDKSVVYMQKWIEFYKSAPKIIQPYVDKLLTR